MDEVRVKLTVYFESPFYVGVVERRFNKTFEICKTTFGKEPTDNEIYEFYNINYPKLKFYRAYNFESNIKKITNPKRIKRMISKEMNKRSISTKSQELLKKQYESRKANVKKNMKLEARQRQKELFSMKQRKKKEKHRGK